MARRPTAPRGGPGSTRAGALPDRVRHLHRTYRVPMYRAFCLTDAMTHMAGDTPHVRVTAADIMRRPVVTVSPTASLRELVGLFRRSGVSGVPVVDVHRHVVGTVSVSDLLWLSGWLAGTEEDSGDAGRAAGKLDETTVHDVMTPDVFGVEPDASLVEVGAFFARTGLGRAVVLDGDELVGIVSVIDLLTRIADQSPEPDPE